MSCAILHCPHHFFKFPADDKVEGAASAALKKNEGLKDWPRWDGVYKPVSGIIDYFHQAQIFTSCLFHCHVYHLEQCQILLPPFTSRAPIQNHIPYYISHCRFSSLRYSQINPCPIANCSSSLPGTRSFTSSSPSPSTDFDCPQP